MQMDEVKSHAARLGRIVYLATVRADGRPHSAPVGVAWIGDTVCAFNQNPSVKVANVQACSAVHLHWAVSADTNHDSLVIDGDATVVDTTEGRAALWNRMGYDLSEFEPGGPASDGHVFLKIVPRRAALLYRFGFDGRESWSADGAIIDLRKDTPLSPT